MLSISTLAEQFYLNKKDKEHPFHFFEIEHIINYYYEKYIPLIFDNLMTAYNNGNQEYGDMDYKVQIIESQNPNIKEFFIENNCSGAIWKIQIKSKIPQRQKISIRQYLDGKEEFDFNLHDKGYVLDFIYGYIDQLNYINCLDKSDHSPTIFLSILNDIANEINETK
jgi:hypothetical protein